VGGEDNFLNFVFILQRLKQELKTLPSFDWLARTKQLKCHATFPG